MRFQAIHGERGRKHLLNRVLLSSFVMLLFAALQFTAFAQQEDQGTPEDEGAEPKSDIQIKTEKSPDVEEETSAEPKQNVPTVVVGGSEKGAEALPPGEELVNIDFPEPTDIKDIIKAVALWTGKNVIFDRNVNGKVQIISPRKVTKVEAYQAFLSALNMLDFTTVETGKVLKIIPVRKAIKGNLRTYHGKNWAPATDKVITQIVPLKYIEAKEVQSTLARIVQSNAMIAYPPTNTLIISETGYKIRRILEIVELLDVKTQQPQVAIVPIKYGDAKSIADKVTQLYKVQTSGKKSASRSYLSYKIMVEERSNSVIIFGPPRTIKDMKALVKKFDIEIQDPARQASIHVRLLEYANAKKLASTLSSLAKGSGSKSSSRFRRTTSRARASTAAASSAAPTVAELGDDLKITADEATNSLIITGSRASYLALNNIIRKLDIRRSQVYVEADIMDIGTEDGFRFGTHLFAGAGSQDEQGTKIATAWQAEPIGPLVIAAADSEAGNAPASAAAAAGVFKDDMTVGILSGAKVTVPGLGTFSPGALIKMIKTDQNSRTIASPHLLTANNEEANITVGQKIYYQKTAISTAGVSTQGVESEDIDLSLNITPNISHSNYVTMKINVDSNSLQGFDAKSNLPLVNKRNSKTIVTVKNGQTVVISGLEQTIESQSFTKIPLLGDIPILGWLFRNSSISNRKSNLTIFLTPHIVHGADDLAAIYEKKVSERDEFFEAVYGSDYKENEFYKFIPKKEDGLYKPDARDKAEDKRQKRVKRELYHDIGISIEGEEIELRDPSVDEQPISVPTPIPDGGGIENEFEAPPPPEPLQDFPDQGGDSEIEQPVPDFPEDEAPPPPPEEEPPPPPPSDGEEG